MKPVSSIVVAVAIGATVAGTLRAEELSREKGYFLTGNGIHVWCQFERSSAQAYTAGVWDHSARTDFDLNLQKGASVAVDAAVSWEKEMLVGYCEPSGVNVGQVTDVFCKYLRDKPEKRNAPAPLLFMEAMKRAWPCNQP
jgi:hypothetical protein